MQKELLRLFTHCFAKSSQIWGVYVSAYADCPCGCSQYRVLGNSAVTPCSPRRSLQRVAGAGSKLEPDSAVSSIRLRAGETPFLLKELSVFSQHEEKGSQIKSPTPKGIHSLPSLLCCGSHHCLERKLYLIKSSQLSIVSPLSYSPLTTCLSHSLWTSITSTCLVPPMPPPLQQPLVRRRNTFSKKSHKVC